MTGLLLVLIGPPAVLLLLLVVGFLFCKRHPTGCQVIKYVYHNCGRKAKR